MSTREVNDMKEWSAVDVFELHQYLQRGYGLEDVARFLCRDVEAVGLKFEELERALKIE
jgi:hypothetical protein